MAQDFFYQETRLAARRRRHREVVRRQREKKAELQRFEAEKQAANKAEMVFHLGLVLRASLLVGGLLLYLAMLPGTVNILFHASTMLRHAM